MNFITRLRAQSPSFVLSLAACCLAVVTIAATSQTAAAAPSAIAIKSAALHAAVKPEARYFCTGKIAFGVSDYSFNAVSTPTTATIALLYTGQTDCLVATLTSISTTTATAFTVVPGGTCGAGLALHPGGSCTVKVTFTPSGTTVFTDTLNVGYTLAINGAKGVASVPLSGN